MGLAGPLISQEPERIATGFQFTEGPVWHPQGYLLFSDIPADRTYRWWPDGTLESFRQSSGNSNGLTLDQEGRLIACQHGNRCVSRTQADGTVIALATRYQERRLNSPNDVVVRSGGSIYFTELFDPAGKHMGTLVTPEQPANLAFGDADGRTLYITARTSVYRVRTDLPGDGRQAGRSFCASCPSSELE